MEDKINTKEVGTISYPQRFLNRIEPVDDKEVNRALFSMYDSLIEPVKNIEADIDRINQNRNRIENINIRSHHSIIKFIIVYIIIFALMTAYITVIETGYEKAHDYSTRLQEKYRTWNDYYEVVNPSLYEFTHGLDAVMYPAYVSVAVVIVWYVLERKKDKEKIKVIEDSNKDIESVIARKVRAIEKEISFVPPKYRHSHALEYFVESYENSRINNLLEAVNAYDTFEHRKNVEGALLAICNILQQIAYNQAVEIEQLKGIRRDIWASEALF